MKLIVNTYIKVRAYKKWYDLLINRVDWREKYVVGIIYGIGWCQFSFCDIYNPDEIYDEEINEVANYMTKRGLW